MYSERLRLLEQANSAALVSEASRASNFPSDDVSIDSRSERDAPQTLDKASEPTTLISCLRSGFYRLFHMPSSPRLGSRGPVFRGGSHRRSLPIATSRLLSTWRLIPSVVLLNVGHYIIRSVACVFATAYWGEDGDRLEVDAELDMTLKVSPVQ
ncbi:unnamed protein product [Echinostoma caproni]|uniref:Uncharacterized protein n=1 Tax=Echinostoma caproni TaxID=27848 RepID=A0A183AW55_9TREM|nr:unnamed protein product [Echinostoma caproni]